MARIETDPNYSTPTFSRATAGTDLFKKEDVQALAAAISTHDHTAGKGLPMAAGSIPNGTITSAMIADGTIVAGDIADGAVTSAKILDGTIVAGDLADGAITSAKILDGTIATGDVAANAITNSVAFAAAITPSSISSSVVAIAGADVSLTTTGGPVLTFFRVPLSHNTANVPITVYTRVDALAWNILGSVWAPSNGAGAIVASEYLWTGLSAATHTWQIGWATGSGTMGVQGGGSITTHGALELKR